MSTRFQFFTASIIIGLLLGAGPLQAEETDPNAPATQLPDPVTASDLIVHAYDANPDIASARAGWRAAVEQYRVATGYPDPQLMVTYFPEPIETRLGPQDWNAVLSQMIPFPGKLARAGEVAAADAEMARVKLDMAVRNLAVDIRESFHELAYIRTAKQIAGEELDLVNHLRKVSETAYADDRANLNDVVRAQSQIGQLRYDRILLDELEATEIARLNELLNRSPDAAIGELADPPIQPPIYTIQEINDMAASYRDEIRMARLAEEKSTAKRELTRYDNLPDFKVGVFYAGVGNPNVPMPPDDAGRDAVGIQFGVSVPLWLGKNRGQAAREEARLEMARADTTARINETRTRIREVYFRLQNARRLIDLYGNELIPQAMNSMGLAETWFREKEASFADAVEAQSVLYNFRLSMARARADYGKYLARLERLVGRSLTQPAEKEALER